MQKSLQEVIERARKLPLALRAAVARELLAPSDGDELSGQELRVLESELNERDTFIPYEKIRRQLGLGPYTKSAKAARRR